MNSTKRKKSDENVKSLFTLNLMTLSAKSAGDLMRRQIHYLKWKRLRDQIHCLLKNLDIISQELLKCSWSEQKLQSCLKFKNSQNPFCHILETLNKNYGKKFGMICSFSSDL